MWWFLKEPFHVVVILLGVRSATGHLTTESIQSAALTFQRVDDVHGGDGLPLGVLRVRDGVPDDVLEENLQNTASLLVDQARDTLHSTSSCQTADGRLRDSLDVIAENLPVTLGASLSQTLATFASTRHVDFERTYRQR